MRWNLIVAAHLGILTLLGCGADRADHDAFATDATPLQDASLDTVTAIDASPDRDWNSRQLDGAAPTDASVADSGVSGDERAGDTSTSSDAAPDGPAVVTTTLRVHYPLGTHTISVRGASGPWTWDHGVATTVGADGTSIYASTGITVLTEWKPLLDDTTWSRGPNYHVAPGQTLDVYPHFVSTHGRVVRLIAPFHSNIVNNDRTVWAYLPASYDENTSASYPVVYMHDGQNLFDASLAFGGNEWMVDETLDAASEDGSIAESIVIGPENTSRRIWEYTPTPDSSVGDGGGGDLYLRMLTDELKPVVDRMLRTRTNRESTAIVGSSLGGLISAYAGVRRADAFGLVGALSPSTWWDNDVIIGDVMAFGAGTPRPLRVYLDSGDSGTSNDDVTQTTMLTQTYVSIGYVEGSTLRHVVQHGATHSEVYWAQRLPGALQFLLGARQ